MKQYEILCPLCQCDLQVIEIDGEISFVCIDCECHFEIRNRDYEED